MEIASAKQALGACFPAVPLKEVEPAATGDDFLVLLVNGSLVFRFPRRRDAEERLALEARLLPLIAPRLPTHVPEYVFRWDGGAEFPHRFVGYARIPGEPLDPCRLGEEPRARCAKAVAGFLTALHRIPTGEVAGALGEPGDSEPWREWYRERLDEVATHIEPRTDAALGRALRGEFEEFLATTSRSIAPALVHRDLGAEHLLVDPPTGRLEGVIDWADATLGDAAFDFTGLLDHPRFLDEVLAAYQGPVDRHFRDRLGFYGRVYPLYEAFRGLGAGDPPRFGAAVRELRRRVLGEPAPGPPASPKSPPAVAPLP